MNTPTIFSRLRDELSDGSGHGVTVHQDGHLPVCNRDDAPRLTSHLMLITACQLYGMSGDEVVLAEVPCAGCGVIPVSTPMGLRGMEPAEWERYCKIREAGLRLLREVQRSVAMKRAGDGSFESGVAA